MSFERVFHGLESFERFLAKQALVDEMAVAGAAEITSHVLYDHVVKVFGDTNKLTDLAQATQDERTALGFTPNDPLLRSGEKLRDTVERLHEHFVAGVGSSDPVQGYHEFGYVNARTGNPVPARPVYEIAVHESEAEVEIILQKAVDAVLGGKGEGLTVLAGLTELVP